MAVVLVLGGLVVVKHGFRHERRTQAQMEQRLLGVAEPSRGGFGSLLALVALGNSGGPDGYDARARA